jgi:hypothetical protein
MSQQVNGYYCRNCAEVELAKHGIDPSRPSVKEGAASQPGKPALGDNQPAAVGAPLGTRLNLFA